MTAETGTAPQALERHERFGVGDVELVGHQQLGDVAGAELAQDRPDRLDLAFRLGRRGVDDVDEEVGVDHLLQRGPERLDQLVGQLADEPDGVGEEHRLAAGQGEAADGGVEGREQPVLHQDPGTGQAVEQRRLAGVGVADQRDQRVLGPAARLALRVAHLARRRPGRAPAWRSAGGCAAGRPRAASHRDPGCRSGRRPARRRRPAGSSGHPGPGGGAGGSGAGPARPGACPPGCGRAGRRCRGSAPPGRRRRP